jgi:hypothetical protein
MQQTLQYTLNVTNSHGGIEAHTQVTHNDAVAPVHIDNFNFILNKSVRSERVLGPLSSIVDYSITRPLQSIITNNSDTTQTEGYK